MKEMFNTRFISVSGLILLAALSRLMPHPDNVTPVTAIALFGGAYFSKKIFAFIVPLAAMLASDLLLGFHVAMPGVYLSFAIIVLIGFSLQNKTNVRNILLSTLAGAVIFFIISNFALWAFGTWYPHSWTGFIECYAMALPFFRNSIVGDLAYSGVIFGCYALVMRYSPSLAKG
ncbi:MAG: hypothetical protein HW421_1255 [Ignavibacteria bacterium]|nr:hypothetical protein [Ignavibacteria bacterium]